MRRDRQESARNSRGRDWPLVVFGALLVLPWVNKPFHVDDPDYLRIARQIQARPWDPYGFELLRGGRWYEAGAVHPSPPLFCYALAAVTAVAGENELALHVFSGLFVVAGAWLAGRLGRRVAGAPWAAAILIVGSPMLLPGQNVMLDVPMIALVLAAVEMQWASVARVTDRGGGPVRPAPLLCGLVLAAACLTKYPALVVVPALALHWRLARGRIPASWLAGVIVPVAAWLAFAWLRYQPSPALERALALPVPLRLADNGVSLLVILGATCLATPLAVRIPVRERGGWLLVFAAVAGGIACVLHRLNVVGAAAPTALELSLRAAFGAGGAILTVGGATAAWTALRGRAAAKSSPRDSQQQAMMPALIAWLVLALALNLVIESTTVRHVLIVLPPLVLLLLHFYHQREPSPRRVGAACALSLLLAVGLADADARFARSSRELADQLARRATSGTTVHVTGEWEFGYYAARAGLVPLHERVRLTPAAALLAVPRYTYGIELGQLPPEWHESMRDAGAAEVLRPSIPAGLNPLRTIAAGVNYYDVGTRNLPWSVSSGPWEEVYLFRIRASGAAGNPKDEARNPKEIQSANVQSSKTKVVLACRGF